MATLRDLGARVTRRAHRGRGARRRRRAARRATGATCRSRWSTSSTATARPRAGRRRRRRRRASRRGAARSTSRTRTPPGRCADVLRRAPVLVEDLADRFAGPADRRVGPSRRRRRSSLPLRQQDDGRPAASSSPALNPLPRRSTTATAASSSSSPARSRAGLADARAYEAERRRAEALPSSTGPRPTFFTNVSHELRTPLTLLLGPAEDALADADEPLGPPASASAWSVVHRNGAAAAQARQHAAGLLPPRVRAGRRRRFEPVDLARYTAELAEHVRRRAVERAGLTLTIDCPPLPEPVLRRPRDVGQDRPQPAVERAEVHLRRRRSRCGCAAERRAPSADGRPTPASASRRADQARLFERFHRVAGAALAHATRAPASGWRWSPSSPSCTAAHVAVDAARPAHGSTFTVAVPFGARRTCRADQVAGADADASDRSAEALGARGASSPRRCAGWTGRRRRPARRAATPADGRAARARRRRQRRHARLHRRAARRASYEVATAADGARRARAGPRPTRPTWCSPT